MDLDPRQRSEWTDQGWLALRTAFDDHEMAAIDAATREVEAWGTDRGLAHYEQTPAGPAIARSEDFEPHQAHLRSLLRSSLITETVDALFGEPGVLFKEKINYKHAGGGGFAPHQDITAYPQIQRCISVMVPLDAADTTNGCLWFTTQNPGVVIENERGSIPQAWCDQQEWTPLEVEPGDVVFFDGLAPHRSDTNDSERSRRAMYLTYNPLSEGDLRSPYYADKRRRLEAADGVGDSGNVLISVNDDFLGKPVEPT
ncbi:MAG: phytanoyl-CoA dioxygenase family protein [Actinomycetota bacterium]